MALGAMPPKFVKVSPSITEDEYIYTIKTQLKCTSPSVSVALRRITQPLRGLAVPIITFGS